MGNWGIVVFEARYGFLLGYVTFDVLTEGSYDFDTFSLALLVLLVAHECKAHLPYVVFETKLFPLT